MKSYTKDRTWQTLQHQMKFRVKSQLNTCQKMPETLPVLRCNQVRKRVATKRKEKRPFPRDPMTPRTASNWFLRRQKCGLRRSKSYEVILANRQPISTFANASLWLDQSDPLPKWRLLNVKAKSPMMFHSHAITMPRLWMFGFPSFSFVITFSFVNILLLFFHISWGIYNWIWACFYIYFSGWPKQKPKWHRLDSQISQYLSWKGN